MSMNLVVPVLLVFAVVGGGVTLVTAGVTVVDLGTVVVLSTVDDLGTVVVFPMEVTALVTVILSVRGRVGLERVGEGL